MEPTQHKSSLFLIISIIIVLGIAGGAGYYYYLKTMAVKIPTPVVKNTLTTPTGMTRDTSGTIPSIFKGLVDINDVKVVQESFIYRDQNTGKTQITFKYISDKDLKTNQKEMLQYISTNKYKFLGLYTIPKGSIIEFFDKENRKVSINLEYTTEQDLQVTISSIY